MNKSSKKTTQSGNYKITDNSTQEWKKLKVFLMYMTAVKKMGVGTKT
jgi:hypothetical protein